MYLENFKSKLAQFGRNPESWGSRTVTLFNILAVVLQIAIHPQQMESALLPDAGAQASSQDFAKRPLFSVPHEDGWIQYVVDTLQYLQQNLLFVNVKNGKKMYSILQASTEKNSGYVGKCQSYNLEELKYYIINNYKQKHIDPASRKVYYCYYYASEKTDQDEASFIRRFYNSMVNRNNNVSYASQIVQGFIYYVCDTDMGSVDEISEVMYFPFPSIADSILLENDNSTKDETNANYKKISAVIDNILAKSASPTIKVRLLNPVVALQKRRLSQYSKRTIVPTFYKFNSSLECVMVKNLLIENYKRNPKFENRMKGRDRGEYLIILQLVD
jgi:hypothetical protein